MRVTFQHLEAMAASTWEQARGLLRDELQRLQSTINVTWEVAHNVDGTQLAASQGQILGQLNGTLAEQPTGLAAGDDGLLYFVSDYGRLVRFNGSTGFWEDAPGTLPGGIIQVFAVAPTGTGWVLCDGGATTRLVVGGATLSTAAFTTPNLTGSPAYLKTGAAYAAIAAASGSVANESAHSHSHSHSVPDTNNESSHTHGVSGTTGDGSNVTVSIDPGGGGNGMSEETHTHNFSVTSAGGSAHSHSFGSNTGSDATAGSAHSHTFGTLDPAHLTVLPYFKR